MTHASIASADLSHGGPLPLICHPCAPTPFPQRVEVSVRAPAAETWTLGYALIGDIAALRVPLLPPTGWADGLWRHTCCEVFIGGGQSGYVEGNFSPSGAWAVYGFRGYREGMTPLEDVHPAIVVRRQDVGRLDLEVVLPLGPLRRWIEGPRWRLGFSVVTENTAGDLFYWALRHPGDRPDFHHPDGFALSLEYRWMS